MAEVSKVVQIQEYNSKWKSEFEKIKLMLDKYIGDLIIGIEHVGSTSVEGLVAKPIIDIDVVMDSYEVFPKIVRRLEKEGFEYEGDLGVDGREAFKRKFDDGLMKYHLYVCPKDGKGYLEHIAFRDYLRVNPLVRDKYGELKKSLAELYRYDIDTYCENKTEFVREILSKTIYKDV